MRKTQHAMIIILLISTLFLPVSYALDTSKWDLPDGVTARLGKGSLESVRYSQDGNWLIVRSSIGMWIYDAHSGVELDFIGKNQSDILNLSRDTQTYASISPENTLQLRSFPDGDLIISLQGDATDVYNVNFSPDGRTLAGTTGQEILLWDIDTGEQKAKLAGHNRSITSFTFSPDGETFVSSSWDGVIQVWDATTGDNQKTIGTPANSTVSVSFSPDGKTLVSSDFNRKKVVFWDVSTWQPKDTLTLPSGSFTTFSPDSRTLITKGGFGRIYLWDIATGTIKTELTGHVSSVTSIAFSPDGSTLASCSSNQLYLWDWRTGEQKLSISGHSRPVYAIEFSPDNNILATGSRTEINIWDVDSAGHKTTFIDDDWAFNSSLTFSPDGQTLASKIGWNIRLWDLKTGIQQATLKGYLGTGASGSGYGPIAFSPDGKYLANTNSYSSILLWYEGRIFKSALEGHTKSVNAIDFSYDSRFLTSGSDDHTVRIWDINTDSLIDTFNGHTDEVHCVAFSPDASVIASGSIDGTIIIWDVKTGIPNVEFQAHPEGVQDITFSLDGKTIASCGRWYDTDVSLWDVNNGEIMNTFSGHSESVYDIEFSSDGKILATGSSDGTVLFWDFASDTLEETQQIAEDVNGDGVVDLQDLIYVASQFGQTGEDNTADVNNDGIVDISDILTVAAALQGQNAAPSLITSLHHSISAADIKQWINQAQQVDMRNPTYRNGIAMLQHLLTVMTPKQTMLLNNYPNPFNPETWIPYQLSENEYVTLHIHSAEGKLIRTLSLGHQPAGIYQSKNRAAYWDGKNELGEPVANGLYFYTLSTPKFSATQRMVIRK